MTISVVPSLSFLLKFLQHRERSSSLPYELIVNNPYGRFKQLLDANKITLYIPQSFISYVHFSEIDKGNTLTDADAAVRDLLGGSYSLFYESADIYKKATSSSLGNYCSEDNDNLIFHDIISIFSALELKANYFLATPRDSDDIRHLLTTCPIRINHFPHILTIHELLDELLDELDNESPQKDIIRVFTPEHEIKHLRSGATVLDFAYKIHSDIGDTCIGATINSISVELNHPLQNGDIVKIITTNRICVQESWLEFTKADTRKIIKRSIREFSYQKGLQIIAEHTGLTQPADYYRALDDIAIDMGISNARCLIVDIGKGNRTFLEIIGDYQINLDNIRAFRIYKEHGISNIEGRSYRISSCCVPLPGDLITAVMTGQNSIVRLHRSNCQNLNNIEVSRHRVCTWRDVIWDVKIQIIVRNIPDTIRPVCNKIAGFGYITDFVDLQEISNSRSSGIIVIKVGITHNLRSIFEIVKQMDRVLDIKVKDVTLHKDSPLLSKENLL
jgi:TGS domain